MTGLDVVMAAFAVVCAGSAALAVTSRRVLHASLWLVVSLGSLAGVYLVLGAEVVALVQLLIYVGAVVVLVLFALMLTRQPSQPDVEAIDSPRPVKALAAIVGAATAVLLVVALVVGAAEGAGVSTVVARDESRGAASALGGAIFSSWVLPFELVSLLLLAALVAAAAVSRTRDSETGTGTGTGTQ